MAGAVPRLLEGNRPESISPALPGAQTCLLPLEARGRDHRSGMLYKGHPNCPNSALTWSHAEYRSYPHRQVGSEAEGTHSDPTLSLVPASARAFERTTQIPCNDQGPQAPSPMRNMM